MFISGKWERLFLLAFILIASYLRFINITKLNYFTYDQARDALFVKRIIVDHEFRLLGTQTSLPGMYLPPYYYYTIAPVLWLFRLNPAGIDMYSAFIGVLTIPLIYYVANKIFGRPAGVFSAGLMAVSPLVVELTRRAWNPNTLPFFILVSFYFLYLYFKEGKTRNFLLAFGFYGYCLSLHFGAWTLIPLFILIWFHTLLKKKLGWLGLLGGFGLIFLFTSPLLFFELRHNFFLTSQAKIFFFDGKHIGASGGNIFESIISSLAALFFILISGRITSGYAAPFEFTGKFKELFALSQPISVVAQKPFSLSFQWWGMLTFLLIFFASLTIFFSKFNKLLRSKLTQYFGQSPKKFDSLSPSSAQQAGRFLASRNKRFDNKQISGVKLIWLWLIWGVFASRLYSGNFYFFYYLYLFPAPFLLFGFLGKSLWSIKKLRLASLTALIIMVGFHFQHTAAFANEWREINDLRSVAKIISDNVETGVLFNIATIQKDAYRWDRNSVDYRYFTESFGKKRALDWYPEDYQKAEFLFVVSEGGQTEVLKSKIMEIEEFSPVKIIGQWQTTKGIVVYKLSKKGKN